MEYASSLALSLCLQNFERELRTLPGDYHPPDGRLLLAYLNDEPVGCVAMRRRDEHEHACEMKRLYVRPAARGHAIGRVLVGRLIKEAREIGYKTMRLDAVEPIMNHAVLLYRDMGFEEIEAYRENPTEGALYMEFKL